MDCCLTTTCVHRLLKTTSVAAPAAVPAAAQDMSEIGEALQRLEGMGMQHATTLSKFSKTMDERTMGLESMLMQAAMNQAKVASTNAETQERLEGMAMQAATESAKFKRYVNEQFEELMTAMVEEMSGAGIGSFGAAQAPSPAPAAADGEVVAPNGLDEGLQRLEGMAVQSAATHAKFEKKMLERTEQLESMTMQAAMDRSKNHSQSSEVLSRLEQMSMQQATNVAKFESKQESKNETMESMLLQASMGHAKFEKLMGDRTSGMEAMLMSAAVGSGKLASMVSKLVPQAEVDLETPDMPTESQYAGTGIGSETAAPVGKARLRAAFMLASHKLRRPVWSDALTVHASASHSTSFVRACVCANRYRGRRVSLQCASWCGTRVREYCTTMESVPEMSLAAGQRPPLPVF